MRVDAAILGLGVALLLALSLVALPGVRPDPGRAPASDVIETVAEQGDAASRSAGPRAPRPPLIPRTDRDRARDEMLGILLLLLGERR